MNWIKTSERLPDETEAVLEICGNDKVSYAFVGCCEKGFWVDHFDEPMQSVTHWQPLPPLPEGQG